MSYYACFHKCGHVPGRHLPLSLLRVGGGVMMVVNDQMGRRDRQRGRSGLSGVTDRDGEGTIDDTESKVLARNRRRGIKSLLRRLTAQCAASSFGEERYG